MFRGISAGVSRLLIVYVSAHVRTHPTQLLRSNQLKTTIEETRAVVAAVARNEVRVAIMLSRDSQLC